MPTPLLSVAEIAERLHVSEAAAADLVRRHAPPGTILANERGYLVPVERLPELRAAIPVPAPRSGHEPLGLEEKAGLLAEAQAAEAALVAARKALAEASSRREAAFAALRAAGVSAGDIAGEKQAVVPVVAAARTARRRRAHW